MTWWAWVLIWTLAVLAAVGVFVQLGRSLWRKLTALGAELQTASERLGVLDEEVGTLAGRAADASEQLAVFADPTALRQAREQGRSGRVRPARQPRHRAVPVRPTEPGRASAR